jgi:hypothetical protein
VLNTVITGIHMYSGFRVQGHKMYVCRDPVAPPLQMKWKHVRAKTTYHFANIRQKTAREVMKGEAVKKWVIGWEACKIIIPLLNRRARGVC